MRSKAIFLFLILFSFTMYSQDKNEPAQEKMGQRAKEIAQLEIEKVSELEAKKAIFSYFYDTKAEVRKLSMALSPIEREQLIHLQEDIWDKSVREFLENYSTVPHGYSKFLRDQYEMLLKYQDVIMDISYAAMQQDLSEQNMTTLLAEKVIAINNKAQRNF